MAKKAHVGVKAYARHRKDRGLPGGTPAAVRKAIARGQIQQDADGLIGVAEADRAWPGDPTAAPLDTPAPPGGNRGNQGSPKGGGNRGNRVPRGGASGEGGTVTLAEAIRRKEVALARRREIEVQELEGDLIRRSVHRERLLRVLSRVSGPIKNIPGSWTPRLGACESDVERMAMLKRLVNELLDELLHEADEIERDAADDDRASA